MGFRLNQYGFIEHYLVSGVSIRDFSCGIRDDNQLRYEQKVRKVIADHKKELKTGAIKVGEDSRLGCPWEYCYSYGNWFVDRSDFYPLVKKIELDGGDGTGSGGGDGDYSGPLELCRGGSVAERALI